MLAYCRLDGSVVNVGTGPTKARIRCEAEKTEGSAAVKSAYLDHAATTPMLPEAIEAMTAHSAQVGNAVVPARRGPARPPGRRGGAGDHRRRARRPAQRGRLHRRRHRGRQPRRQGPLLGPPRRRRRDPRPGQRRSSTTRCSTRRTGWPTHEGARSSCSTSTRTAASHPTTLAAAIERDRTASPWSASCGPTTRSAPCSRSPSSPRSPTTTACRSTPTPFRRSASCRSTSPRAGVDALTLTGHKVGGPMGVGALLLAAGRRPGAAVLHGGGQERDVRSGTLDAAGDRGLRHRPCRAAVERRRSAPAG